MEIKELKDGMRKVSASGVIKGVGDSRTVNLKNGDQAKVVEVILGDSSGEISLVLWNDDIERVKENSIVSVEGGYTSQWQGKVKLNVGKFGKLTVDA